MGPEAYARRFLLLFGLFVLYSTTSNAQYRITGITYGGSGCPAGSASASVTDDQSAISVLFDQLISESGSSVQRQIDRKACLIRQSVDVLAGFQIKLKPLKIKGFVGVPIGGVATIETTTAYVGISKPIRKNRVFRGPAQDNFEFDADTLSGDVVWTPCGRSVLLEHGLVIRTTTNSKMDQTMISAEGIFSESQDLFKPIRLEFRRCD